MSLDPRQRTDLLGAARSAVESAARGERPPAPPAGDFPFNSGVFVTLHVDGELRGCIGFVDPGTPLADSVVLAARRAACEDFRFHPVRVEELSALAIEISLLSPRERISSASELVVGTHGLIVEHRSGRRGLLLPQVAADNGWDGRRFLDETYRKGMIDPSNGGATIYRFTAEVFSG